MLCDKLFRFRAEPECADPKFLIYTMRQRTSRSQIESSTNGASDSMQNIGQDVIRNLLLTLPPLDEQRNMVVALEAQTSTLLTALAQANREIALLREYRTRLIADVVTGKLDDRFHETHHIGANLKVLLSIMPQRHPPHTRLLGI